MIWHIMYLGQVQSFLTALRALSHKDFHYGSYATSEQVAYVFFTSSIVTEHKLMKISEICSPHSIIQHTPLCSVFRWLLLEICVRYAKKRCMFPSFCVANISFVKIVYPNGNPPPDMYMTFPCTFHVSFNDFIAYLCFLGIFLDREGLRGSGRARFAGHWWSQQTSGHSVTVQQASSSSYSSWAERASWSAPLYADVRVWVWCVCVRVLMLAASVSRAALTRCWESVHQAEAEGVHDCVFWLCIFSSPV